MDIIILGPGCPKCKKVYQLAIEAVAELGLEEVTLRKATDWDEIMKYNVLSTPGLVINGKVVCSGRIPTKNEIKQWLSAVVSAKE